MTDATSTNLAQLLLRRRRDDGPRAALWIRCGAEYSVQTWSRLSDDVLAAVATLASLGVGRGDRVAQVSENRYEWILADLAILALGAIHVPIHATLSGPQIAHQLAHCDPRVVLLSGPTLTDKLSDSALATSPAGAEFLASTSATFLAYDSVCGRIAGRECALAGPAWYADGDRAFGQRLAQEMAESVPAEHPATILYTSGTTGQPRGVVLSHGNLLANTRGILAAFGDRHFERRLCFLPLSHIYARTCDLYVWLVSGTEMALAASPETALPDCQATRPTFLNGVPYFYGRVVGKLREWGRAAEPGVLRGALGGRIEQCSCGGAPTPDSLVDYFNSQGVALLPGYGLTEASPVVTASTVDASRRGCVGRALPGVEIRLADDGEILTRGPNVMLGYYREPEATASALRDGWLQTGDLGRWESEGFLRITGRKKELICTALGKNVVPSMLEGLLTQDPLIQQAAIVGEGRSFLAALIVPNVELLPAVLQERQIDAPSIDAALMHPALQALFAERIQQRLRELSPHEQIRRFALLPRGFSVDHDELTPKLSLRRHVIEAHFREQIEALYSP